MTLSETAQLTKKIMVYVVIGLVVIFALWGGIAFYLSTRKVEIYIPPPTQGFGLLPKTALPKSRLSSSSVSFNLDTPTGGLPKQAAEGATPKQGEIPDRMNVYAIPKVGVTFASPERARRIAAGFSFKNGPKIESPTLYRFTDDKGGVMVYSLDSGNFKFKRPVATKSAEFVDQEAPSIETENILSNNFRKYMGEQGAMPDQLAAGKSATFYNNSKVEVATEAAVTIWQQQIEEGTTDKIVYPIVSPTFKEGLVKATVTRYQAPENKYLSVDYIFWQIDTKKFESYKIKSVEEAYKQLQSGEGITILPYSKSTVAIEKIYLAYYLPEEYTPYLQPVFVFEGPGYAAYIPALTANSFEP